MNNVTNNDYKKILDYYKIPNPKSTRLLKMKAEHILATKLCRCIKKVGITNKSRSIGICTKTVLNRKGYKRGAFNCKGNQTVKFNKITKNKTMKTKTNKTKTKK
jgi:hypothetical protein